MSKLDKLTKSSNPMMKEEKYRNNTATTVLDGELVGTRGEVMTVQGATTKTLILAAILLVTTVFSYGLGNPILMYVGIFGGMGVALFAGMKPHLSPYLAPTYAALEGLFIGTFSAYMAASYGGIIFQALSLTIGVLFAMLFIYKTGIIQVTDKFRAIIGMATGAVMLVYLLNFVLSFFGMNVPYLHQGGAMGIGISAVILGIASMRLLVDFDNFDKGEKMQAAKYMEWYSAMGLLATLIWIYYEMVWLLAQIAGND